ncbi:hypothetical protein [Vreelandella gomseomensis]|uniref:Uncharacterized protein n=1 Tax=Vreelandella gomseomensis TaxID=370766 RepID=A0ABU1GDB7_9GAMM|nr:hypothetical protein [Halomonas gomseomensis]MDR5875485.1 hypothetical protein [Halomonas gomseomensis]
MINVNSYLQQPPTQSTEANASRTRSATKQVDNAGSDKTPEPNLSPLARQLNEAQARADVRDASMDRDALASKAKTITDQLIGRSYHNNKARHDAEVPDTDNPVLLERAKQATDFVNGKGSNPFIGMAPDQLTLIIYDESDAFTVNERRAAWKEQYDQRQEWKKQIVAEIMRESKEKGTIIGGLTKVLEHYENLPPIEQAQYPDFWLASLNSQIAHYGNQDSLSGEGRKSLLELMEPAGLRDNLEGFLQQVNEEQQG